MKIKIRKLGNFDKELGLPEYKTPGSAGMDVKSCLDKPLVIRPGERVCVPTGLSFEFPEHMEMQVRPRSGLSLKSDLMVCNSPGTVDSDYRGELMVIIGNFGNRPYTIEHGTRIAQIVFCPVLRVELEDAQDLSKTTREGGGFGSTGSK